MPRFTIDANLPCFTKDLKEAAKKHPSVIEEDLKKAIRELEDNPKIGVVIPGLGAEVRKLRIGIKKENVGKSGGFRLIYLVQDEKLSLLFFYFKPKKENISNIQIVEAMQELKLLHSPLQDSSKTPTVN